MIKVDFSAKPVMSNSLGTTNFDGDSGLKGATPSRITEDKSQGFIFITIHRVRVHVWLFRVSTHVVRGSRAYVLSVGMQACSRHDPCLLQAAFASKHMSDQVHTSPTSGKKIKGFHTSGKKIKGFHTSGKEIKGFQTVFSKWCFSDS